MAISLAVCILHNICTVWNMPDPPPAPADEDDEDINGDIVLEEDLERDEIRARAVVLRDRLRNNMPPPTPSERRRIRDGN